MPLDERDESRLRDMIRYARNAIILLGSMAYEEMEANLAVKLALVRCVEVIGEASDHIDVATQALLPAIPWHAMYGMRNRLIHDYGNTDLRIVFRVVREELPGLVRTMESFLAAHQDHPGDEHGDR